ncbi:MAG: DNA-binding response regulator [Desulfobacteraceae bacterium]|nr:MAG: DNA-binding response regulator [Desulfobacteraceae bacterium]
MGMKDLINSEDDITVIGEADNVADAMDLVEEKKPDLVIVDLSLKESDGINIINDVEKNYPNIYTLVLSMHNESLYAERCIMAGAKGYIMKQEASESVVNAIRHIMSDKIYVSPNIMANILNRFQNQRDQINESPLKTLTDREMEIFHLIGLGMLSKDIAIQLNISIKTVGAHRERIKQKLGIKHNNELIRRAAIWVETGLF